MINLHICTKSDIKERDPLWVDREGREYWCDCQITDSHLVNIIRLLQRTSAPFPVGVQGEMAEYYMMQGYDIAMEDRSDSLALFEDVARKRGLVLES